MPPVARLVHNLILHVVDQDSVMVTVRFRPAALAW